MGEELTRERMDVRRKDPCLEMNVTEVNSAQVPTW